jgi:hypothetical protein
MIHQYGRPTRNQHHHKQEIKEVAIPHPDWRLVRTCEVVGIYLGNRLNMGQSRLVDYDGLGNRPFQTGETLFRW